MSLPENVTEVWLCVVMGVEEIVWIFDSESRKAEVKVAIGRKLILAGYGDGVTLNVPC